MAKGYDFRLDRGGIEQVFKSSWMQGELAEAAERLAARASDDAERRYESTHRDPAAKRLYASARSDQTAKRTTGTRKPAYFGGVDVAEHTAIGFVGTANVKGGVDELVNKTLEGLNH